MPLMDLKSVLLTDCLDLYVNVASCLRYILASCWLILMRCDGIGRYIGAAILLIWLSRSLSLRLHYGVTVEMC